MHCRSSPEDPPSRCLDPTISLSPWRRVVVVKTLRIHTALTFAQPPDRGVAPVLQAPSGGCGNHPHRFAQAKSGTHHQGSAEPYQEDLGRLTQLITAVPGPRPRAGSIPNTAAGVCASACARPGLAGEHRDQSWQRSPPPPPWRNTHPCISPQGAGIPSL